MFSSTKHHRVVALAVAGSTTAVAIGLGAPAPAFAAPVQAAAVRPIPGTNCPTFPANNWWHANISTLPRNRLSAAWLGHMGASSRQLHPDFGPSWGEQPVPYGIPITVVRGAARVPVAFEYDDESDHVRYPLNFRTLIEGGANSGGDRHAIVVDANTCRLFETWNTRATTHGWTAGSGATWSLLNNNLRPVGWTSADAAGLPILPGLLRYDEVAAGRVDHAIRFTTNITSRGFVWPARHQAGATNDATYPPMGARFRLKAGYSTAGYSTEARTVLTAMKTYGLVLADNGSPWYFQGTSDTRWRDSLISELKRIPASAFEAVDTSSLKLSANSAAVRPR